MKMIWNEGRERFEAITEFREKDIPKGARFRWDREAKRWWTNDAKKAKALENFIEDETTRARLDAIFEGFEKSLESSRALDSDFEVPAPDGLEYMPFQKAGIAYGANRSSVLIADEMGLGKTMQAIGLINLAGARSVLVICPASLKLNWKRELEKWLTTERSIMVAKGKLKAAPDADIVIINYDIVGRNREALDSREWDVMIVDECHYLKNPKAGRTKAIFGTWDRDPSKRVEPIKAPKQIFLTGTPLVNRLIEAWPLVKHLGIVKSWKFYVQRYCAGHQKSVYVKGGRKMVWDVSGASNVEEFQDMMRQYVMVRRRKADVLTDLPAKRRQVIEIPANGLSGILNEERASWERFEDNLAELQARVELAKVADNDEDYVSAMAALNEGMMAMFTEISRIRHETALAKVPFVVEHVRECVDSVGKVILFAHHKDVISQIVQEFDDGEYVVLTGDTPQKKRQENVDRFQDDPDCKLFVGTIGAAGVGLTLTASAHVVFCELDWVPGNISQAEDRAHRIGQESSVLIQHLVLEGSLDAVMAHRIIEKQKIIDAALDTVPMPVEPILPLPEPATKKASREWIEKEAVVMDESEILIIHGVLKWMVARCDGAIAEDGMGFNGLDSLIGKSLARTEPLTAKQAVLGASVLRKYRNTQWGDAFPEYVAIVDSRDGNGAGNVD